MKKILSSPIVGEIPRLKNMLENAGIACFVRNEISAGLSPEIPLTESTPELWIEDDDKLTEALQIKADFQTSATMNDLPKAGAEHPQKLIIVLGVWLFFGSIASVAAILVVAGLYTRNIKSFILGTLVLLFFLTIIWMVTRNYFASKRPQEKHDA
jgi:Putative prokaryotic signal transducing protein